MAYTTINKSSDHFNTKLYTGNATANHAITGVGFKPDFLWIKPRNMANDHRIHSSIGLSGSDYFLHGNSTNVETQNSNCVTSFDTDGFTLGNTDPGWNGNYNYVSWNWKAGNSAGSSNSDGSLTSTVSVNSVAGMSIVTYSGTGASSGTETVGHGLNAVPKVILQKRVTGSAQNWHVYHASMGNGGVVMLNDTQALNSQTDYWGNTSPTNSVITIGPNNLSSGTNIMYCFAEKKGFSKFGSYQGNSSADGVFCYLGFKPAWVMIKQATGGNANEVWSIRDNKRDTFNPIAKSLFPNNSSAEATTSTHYVDFVSNGFKIRTGTENALNTNYGYIYMAFAEAPLVGSNNVPCTAR